MLYVLETNLKKEKPISFSLTSIYGLGYKKSYKLIKRLGFSNNLPIHKLNKLQQNNIKTVLMHEKLFLGSLLKKKEATLRTKRIEIKHLKELRRLKGYPVNGQRTRSNAKTAKKKRY